MDLRYWDANCFLGWLKGEPDKVEECRVVLEQAEAGKLRIVTSALTLAEVVKLKKGNVPIPAEDAQKVRDFFKQPYIDVRNVERYVAERAQELVWQNVGLDPKDAIHVATALQLKLSLFNTFDEALLGLSERFGNPPLVIERPRVEQGTFDLGEDE